MRSLLTRYKKSGWLALLLVIPIFTCVTFPAVRDAFQGVSWLVDRIVDNYVWLVLSVAITSYLIGDEEALSFTGIAVFAVVSTVMFVFVVPVWEFISPFKWWVVILIAIQLVTLYANNIREKGPTD